MSTKIKIILTVSFLAYLVQGLNDGALGVAWPNMRYELLMPLEFAGILTITAFMSYSIVVSQFGKVSNYLKPQQIALLGIFLVIIANLGLFVAPNFFIILVMVSIIAGGQAFIESSINTYLARHFTARYINFGLCFWGMGATIGPIIMSQMVNAFNWRLGYFAILFIQISVGILMYFSIKKGAWIQESTVITDNTIKQCNYRIKFTYQFLQMIIFFIFTGTQTAFGFWIYTVMLESRNLSISAAGMYPALYFGFIMVGRIFFGAMAKKFSNMWLIRIGIVTSFIGVLILSFTTHIFAVMLVGFGISPIFPCLIHETTRRFPPFVLNRQMGYQLSAAGFGEIISSFLGIILALTSLESLFYVIAITLTIGFLANEAMGKMVASENYVYSNSVSDKITSTDIM